MSRTKKKMQRLPDNFNEVMEQAVQLKREVPKRSVRQIIKILELEGWAVPGVLKQSTMQRHIYEAGLGKKQMKRYAEKREASSRRFCRPHRMELLQGPCVFFFFVRVCSFTIVFAAGVSASSPAPAGVVFVFSLFVPDSWRLNSSSVSSRPAFKRRSPSTRERRSAIVCSCSRMRASWDCICTFICPAVASSSRICSSLLYPRAKRFSNLVGARGHIRAITLANHIAREYNWHARPLRVSLCLYYKEMRG